MHNRITPYQDGLWAWLVRIVSHNKQRLLQHHIDVSMEMIFMLCGRDSVDPIKSNVIEPFIRAYAQYYTRVADARKKDAPLPTQLRQACETIFEAVNLHGMLESQDVLRRLQEPMETKDAITQPPLGSVFAALCFVKGTNESVHSRWCQKLPTGFNGIIVENFEKFYHAADCFTGSLSQLEALEQTLQHSKRRGRGG